MCTNTSTPKILPVEVIQTGARRRWTVEEKLRIAGPLPIGLGRVKAELFRWTKQLDGHCRKMWVNVLNRLPGHARMGIKPEAIREIPF